MKKLIIPFVIALLLSINAVAQDDNNTIQVTLKTQNLGLDKNFGVYRANITITTNKVGHLTYRESFYLTDYSSGVAGRQVLFKTNSYDVVMNDYTVSFGVTRPGLKSERDAWNTIIATVLIDNNQVYQTQISQSGTYRSFTTGKSNWANDSSIGIGKTRPTIEKKPGPQFTSTVQETTNTENTDIINTTTDPTNITDMPVPKQTPMLGTSAIIVAIFMVYLIRGNSRKK